MFFLRIFLNWFNFIVGGKDNAIILASFLSFVATLILVIVTNKYVKLTKNIAADNNKYLKITEDKEKIDRTLDYISKFDLKRFMDLTNKMLHDYPRSNYRQDPKKDFYTLFPETMQEVEYFINYFDTIAILYFKNKFDTELFEIKIEPYFFNFSINFENKIIDRIKNLKAFDVKIFYWYRNLLNLILNILEKKRNLDPDGWGQHFNEVLKVYTKLLDYAE